MYGPTQQVFRPAKTQLFWLGLSKSSSTRERRKESGFVFNDGFCEFRGGGEKGAGTQARTGYANWT
jgi:hypothetical protein